MRTFDLYIVKFLSFDNDKKDLTLGIFENESLAFENLLLQIKLRVYQILHDQNSNVNRDALIDFYNSLKGVQTIESLDSKLAEFDLGYGHLAFYHMRPTIEKLPLNYGNFISHRNNIIPAILPEELAKIKT